MYEALKDLDATNVYKKHLMTGFSHDLECMWLPPWPMTLRNTGVTVLRPQPRHEQFCAADLQFSSCTKGLRPDFMPQRERNVPSAFSTLLHWLWYARKFPISRYLYDWTEHLQHVNGKTAWSQFTSAQYKSSSRSHNKLHTKNLLLVSSFQL